MKKDIRKFNVILPEKDPFEIDDDNLLTRRSWDWFFEMKAYDVKRQTLKEFDKLITQIVDNRDIIEEIFSICMVDLTAENYKIDQSLHNFLISRYSRMIKTSKVIQNLIIDGNYIESKSLLRTNFENMIEINYFLLNPEKLEEYQSAIKNNNKKILSKYKIKDITLSLSKNYDIYKHLCNFVHANSHLNDLMDLNINNEAWMALRCYNYFEGGESASLLVYNNNLLIEGFAPIKLYLSGIIKFIGNKKAPPKIKNLINKYKKIKIIKLINKPIKE